MAAGVAASADLELRGRAQPRAVHVALMGGSRKVHVVCAAGVPVEVKREDIVAAVHQKAAD